MSNYRSNGISTQSENVGKFKCDARHRDMYATGQSSEHLLTTHWTLSMFSSGYWTEPTGICDASICSETKWEKTRKATGVSFTRWRRRANAVADELKEIQNKITFSPELSDCKFRTLVDNGQRCQLIHSSVADKAEKKKAFNLNFWASNIHRFVLGSHNFLYCFFYFFFPNSLPRHY